MARPSKKAPAMPRNPERSRARILAAALKEFSAKGFAGARVDAIARRACINKRMLYHYFGDKEELFKAVLRRKISQRQGWAEALSGAPEETLPFWFEAACKDPDWTRLFEWEALQGNWQKVIDEEERLQFVERGLERIRQRQARGLVDPGLDPRHVMLTMRSLTMFPIAFPQLTRLITGKSIFDPKFQKERIEFLKKFAAAFRPHKSEDAPSVEQDPVKP
jgi:TetR/AcrR family transcriptional regulator